MKRMLTSILTVVMLIGCCGILTGCTTEISLSDETKTKLEDATKEEIDATEPESDSESDNGFSKKKVPAATPTPEPTPTPNSFASPTKTLELNETITVGNTMELTLESVEWVDEVLPSVTDDSYTYYKDKEGETYFVIRGTVKNLCGEVTNLDNRLFLGEMLVNGTYKSDLQADEENSEGTGFSGYIKPLQTANVVFFASVSDGVYELAEDVTVTMKLMNDAEYANEYFRENKHPHDVYVLNLTAN